MLTSKTQSRPPSLRLWPCWIAATPMFVKLGPSHWLDCPSMLESSLSSQIAVNPLALRPAATSALSVLSCDVFPFVASPTPPTGSISWGQFFVNEPELAITSPHIAEERSPLIDECSVREQASHVHVMADKSNLSSFYACLSCILYLYLLLHVMLVSPQ
ncbi:hypothetical protein GALMADRAFT_1207037 [Galerina marginata CBS 339.88]|uniref:Uncharacterized protein n=1 Tax=Galerina marginata (strain CBS 339.88) TaxID=685588 RepID=A0A067SHG2_GALM3|nr:hypothetical protein GALMADRAFT_1207037 [Galerina marginata CBS 339.88]